MTDLSTPSKQAFAEQGQGLSFSKSISEIIHEFILDRMPAPGQTLADAATHHFAAPGKMLRAKMAVRAADLLKVDRPAALHWAAAIEVLHNASLIQWMRDALCRTSMAAAQ